MHWLMFVAVFVLYLTVLRVKRPEPEPRFLFQVVGLYLLVFFLLLDSASTFLVVVTLFITFCFILSTEKRNRDLKGLAAFFLCVYFFLILIVPPLGIGELKSEWKKQEYIESFTSVESVTEFPPDAAIQKSFVEYMKKRYNLLVSYDSNDTYTYLFRTWIMKEHGAPLQYAEPYDDHFTSKATFEHYSQYDFYTIHAYATFQGKNYFAVFKRAGEREPYLFELFIEHNGFKPGEEPDFESDEKRL